MNFSSEYKSSLPFFAWYIYMKEIETMEEIKDLSSVMLGQVREETPNLERK